METGGAFMGNANDVGWFLVEHMIGPGPRASHRRTSFQPDATWQWSEMERVYTLHDGNILFLGDWHTHPGKMHGDLSWLDIRAIKQILDDPKSRAKSIFSVILYGGRKDWTWSAWLASIRQPDGDLFIEECSISTA